VKETGKKEKSGEKCITGSFIICNFAPNTIREETKDYDAIGGNK
jgi:hypothetical protein